MASIDEYFARKTYGPPLSQNEEMRYEMIRLSSYLGWPMYAPVQPTPLASAGFFYTGTETQVKCFSCLGTVDQWNEGDTPMDKHRAQYPTCLFVRGIDTQNVPIAVHTDYMIPEWSTDTPINADLLHNEVANFRLFMQNVDTSGWNFVRLPANSNSNYVNPRTLNLGQNTRDTINEGSRNVDSQEGVSTTVTADTADMKIERNRLLTYGNWPFSAPIRPSELARAGFYYTNIADRVECAFCHGILRDWEVGDLAMEEHRRHFSACPFINGDDVGNVPEASTVSVQKQSSMHQTQHRTVEQAVISGLANMQLQGSSPAATSQASSAAQDVPESFPAREPPSTEYATIAARCASFTNGWMQHLNQTVETLAEAGFYFVGPGDNVKCFECAGSLRSWEPNDDPWTEHARWFPNCRYVREKKGEEFIRTATQANPVQTPAAPPAQSTAATAPSARTASSAVEYRVEAREIKARLDSPMSQTVIRMGYDPYLVSKTIERRLKEIGDDFTDVETFVEALLEMEPELAQQGLVTRRPVEPRSSPSVLPLTQNITRLAMPPHGQPYQTGRVIPAEGSEAPASVAAPAGSRGPTEQEEQPTGTTGGGAPTPAKGKKKKTKKKKTPGKEAVPPTDTEATGAASGGGVATQGGEESKSLSEEIRQLKEARTCKICMDAELNVVFLPCGHLVSCQGCAPALRTCPICRTVIRGTVKTYLA